MKAQSTQFKRFSVRHQSRKAASRVVLGLGLLAATTGLAHADRPGRGGTAQFEKNYLVFIINHHYSALRMTELAAGTDPMRDPQVVSPQEGTSPTPGFGATPAKASDDEIRSMAAWETASNARKLHVRSKCSQTGTASGTSHSSHRMRAA